MGRKHLIIILIVCLLLVGALFVRNANNNLKAPNNFLQKNYPTSTQTQQKNEDPITAEYTNGISLDVFQPQHASTVTNPTITVKGKTAPLADVFINEAEMKADTQGYFSTNLTLDEGENPIVIVVNDESGNSAEKELVVTYEAQ